MNAFFKTHESLKTTYSKKFLKIERGLNQS